MTLTLEQKEFRRRGASASDVAGICGLTRWSSPIKVFEQKVHPPEPDDEPTEDQECGIELEDSLLNWTSKRTGVPIFHNTGPEAVTFQSAEHELVLATPDGLGFGEGVALPESFEELRAKAASAICVAEVKSPGPNTVADWVNPLEMPDGIPEYYIPQVHWQMGALGLDRVLVGSGPIWRDRRRHFWVYSMDFNRALFESLLAEVEKFWKYVERAEPPPVDGTRDYAEHLKKRFPRHLGEKFRQSTAEIDVAVARLREAEQTRTSMEEVIRLEQNRIKEFVGEAPGMEGPWGKIHWRKSKDSEGWDTAAMLEFLRERFEPEVVGQFRKVSAGARPFKPAYKKQ